MTAPIRIVGPDPDRQQLTMVSAWQRTVARYLGVPIPLDGALWIHRQPGVSWTGADGIHLLDSWRGEPDIGRLPHELVHMVAGASPSRLLAEGLAVHVAHRLSLAPPSWPCYRLEPDSWVVALRGRGVVSRASELVAAAASVRLAGLAAAGEGAEAAGQAAWRLYVEAGSFVGHLFECAEREEFWSWYRSGSLGEDETVERLEREWLDRLPSVLDPDKAALLAASLNDAAAELAGASQTCETSRASRASRMEAS